MARTEQQTLDAVAAILHDVCGIAPDRVRPEKTFIDELGVDSLSMYEIAMSSQDVFGVEVPDEDMKGLRTVGDLVAYVRNASVSV